MSEHPNTAEFLARHKYVLFTTFRKTGAPVSTPVWLVGLDRQRVAFTTSGASGKVKRLRHNSSVTLQVCDVRGRVDNSKPVVDGTAHVVREGDDYDTVRSAVRRKYWIMSPLIPIIAKLTGQIGRDEKVSDTVVIVNVVGLDLNEN